MTRRGLVGGVAASAVLTIGSSSAATQSAAIGRPEAPPVPAMVRPMPDVEVVAPPADVVVEGEVPQLSLFHLSGGGFGGKNGNQWLNAYDPLCTAPCRLTLPAGMRRLAVAGADGVPVLGAPIAIPPGPVTLRVGHESKAGTRTAGLITFTGGLIAAPVALVAILYSDGHEECPPNGECRWHSSRTLPAAVVSGGILAVTATLGMIWLLENDTVRFTVVPGHPASALRDRGVKPRDELTGLSIVGNF
jgi:hypothetical protein